MVLTETIEDVSMMQWLLSTISPTSLISDATSAGALAFIPRQVLYSAKNGPSSSTVPGGGGGGRTPLASGGSTHCSMKGMKVRAQSALPGRHT